MVLTLEIMKVMISQCDFLYIYHVYHVSGPKKRVFHDCNLDFYC